MGVGGHDVWGGDETHFPVWSQPAIRAQRRTIVRMPMG